MTKDEAEGEVKVSKKKSLRHNNSGQLMRGKGHSTRTRIIEQTMKLLSTSQFSLVTGADIARACDITPPALYRYFDTVPDIVMAKLVEIHGTHHRYMNVLESPIDRTDAFQHCLAFVHAYVEYWVANYTALKYRNVMSDQGDERFMRMRVEMIRPVTDLLEKLIKEGQNQGATPSHLDAASAAGAAIALVDHAASVASFPYGSLGWSRDGFLSSTAYLLMGILKDPRQQAQTAPPLKKASLKP